MSVHTDVWTSMGQEQEATARKVAFEGFQVDRIMMAQAASGAMFFHCLPAHRGEEVAADVIDGPRSHVFQQGHNRMHTARGLLRRSISLGRSTRSMSKVQRQQTHRPG